MTAPIEPYRVIRSMPELIEAFRARRDELQITHATIEDIGLLPDGYVSKVLALRPIKNIGPKALEGLLDGLGAVLQMVPNPHLQERVKAKWVKRKRPQKPSALLICSKRAETPETHEQLGGFAANQNRMSLLGKKGGEVSGKTRRRKAMRRRELQRKRSHAARLRWARCR